MLEEAKNTVSQGVDKTVGTAEKAAEATAQNPYAKMLGRFGYFTKGVLYLLIGALAAASAIGMGGGLTDRKGLIGIIAAAPFGNILLIAVIIGALGYGLWSILRGFADVDGKGSDAKGWIIRLAFIGVGISYMIFAWWGWGVYTAAKSVNDNSSSPQTLSQRVLELPFGMWILAAVGLIIIGVGLFQIYKAFTKKFMERLDLSSMNESKRNATINFGRFGYIARGIIFAVIGFFLTRAAWNYNPNEAKGVDDALATIASQNYGSILLSAIALGLICFGIFSMIEAFYRRFGKISPEARKAANP